MGMNAEEGRVEEEGTALSLLASHGTTDTNHSSRRWRTFYRKCCEVYGRCLLAPIATELVQGADASEISEETKASLINIQVDEYGERLGKRKLDALILAAVDDGDSDSVQGMDTIEPRLLDMQKDILSADISERMLAHAVASLGPKHRREYKDASAIDIANQLLPPDVSAVCSLSNLCVSPSARRKGLAAKLCNEAERVAKEELGFDETYLRVEAANDAAKRLYEEKLGYESVCEMNRQLL